MSRAAELVQPSEISGGPTLISVWKHGSHLVVRVLNVPIRYPVLKRLQQIPPRVREAEHWEVRLAFFEARSSQEDVAHDAQAVVGKQGVALPARGAAVAAAESLAVPQQPVEPQAELQVLDALSPVLSPVLLQRVAVRGVQRHDVLLGETSQTVLLILSLHQSREEKEQAQSLQEHHGLHRLQQQTVLVLNGSGHFCLYQGMLMSGCT